MTHELVERETAMREHAWHIRPRERIGDEAEHDRHHRDADDAPRRLHDEQDADQADGEIRRRHRAGAQHELLVLQHDVGGRRRAKDSEHDIERMHLRARPALARRVEEVDEREAEAEVHGALQLRVKHAERRRVELEDGKRNRECRDELRHEARVLHRIGIAVVFLEDLLRELFLRFFTHT